VKDRVEIIAPSLLFFEVTNAVLVALRRERISKNRADDILHTVNGLSIPVIAHPDTDEVFKIAIKHRLSAYDATYAALTTEAFSLITGDRKLYEALKGEKQVMLIGEPALWIVKDCSSLHKFTFLSEQTPLRLLSS